MYINASQQERDLSITAIYNENQLISTIQKISRDIFYDIMEGHNLQDKELENISMNLELVFDEDDDSPETNAARLKFIIENTKDVLVKINNDQKIEINGYDTPNYNLTLYSTVEDSRFFLTAYSNFDDDMLWDEMIEWVDDLGYNDDY